MSSPEAPAAGRAAPVLLFGLIALRIAVSPSIYPWTGVAWNAAALLFLLLTLDRPGMGGRDFRPGWALIAGVMLYLLPALVSSLLWAVTGRGLFPISNADGLRWTLTELGGLLLFAAVTFFPRLHPRVPAAAVVTAACLSATFALRQRLGGFAGTLTVDGISEYARQTLLEGRVFGLTFSPDLLAATVAGALPLAAALLWLSRREGRTAWQFLAAAAVALLLAVLVLTRSLGGTIAAAAGAGVWLLTFPALSRRRRVGLLVAGAGAAVIAAGAVVIMRGGHLFNFSNWNNPLLLRLDNWRTAIRVWREFPLTGAGPGQYGLAMFAHRSPCGNEAKHVHNLLLETLAELGPAGLAGLVLIIASFVRAGVRQARESAGIDGADLLHGAFFASGSAILVHAMIDFSWQTPEAAAMFWVALAVMIPGAPDPGKWPPRQKALAVFVVGLLCLGMGWEGYKSRLRGEALALGREGEWREAGELAGKFIALDPRDDEIFALKAQADFRQKRLAPAVAGMKQAIALNPRFPFYYRDLALWSADPTERLSLMRQAVGRYPNSAPLNTLLGRMLLDQGRLVEAERVLVQAAGICRESGDAMTMLGMLYDRQGNKAEAEAWLRRGAAASPPSEARRQILIKFLSTRAPAPSAPVPPAP